MAKKLKPKDFVNPLLVAMGHLSKWTPNQILKIEDVHTQVVLLSKVDEAIYGYIGDTQRTYVQRWVERAFNQHLINQKLGARSGRGQWSLTPEGIKEAEHIWNKEGKSGLRLNFSRPKSYLKSKDNLISSAKDSPEKEPLVIEKPKRRTLTTSAASCFSYYSVQDSTCKRCFVSDKCKIAQLHLLEDLEKEIREI